MASVQEPADDVEAIGKGRHSEKEKDEEREAENEWSSVGSTWDEADFLYLRLRPADHCKGAEQRWWVGVEHDETEKKTLRDLKRGTKNEAVVDVEEEEERPVVRERDGWAPVAGV